jgi:hypothetical protein
MLHCKRAKISYYCPALCLQYVCCYYQVMASTALALLTNIIPVTSCCVFLQIHSQIDESIREHVLFSCNLFQHNPVSTNTMISTFTAKKEKQGIIMGHKDIITKLLINVNRGSVTDSVIVMDILNNNMQAELQTQGGSIK